MVLVESPTRGDVAEDYEIEDFIDLLADLEDCEESSAECKGSGSGSGASLSSLLPSRPLPLPPACCKITFSGNNTAVLSSNSSAAGSLVYDRKAEVELIEEGSEECKTSSSSGTLSPPNEELDDSSPCLDLEDSGAVIPLTGDDSCSQTTPSFSSSAEGSSTPVTSLALTTTSSSTAITAHKPKKRNRFRPRVSPFPRILKRDVRRDIPTMLINCLNSANPEIIGGWFYQFCIPNCKMNDTLMKANVLLQQLEGVDKIANMLGFGIADVPDFICRIRETCIKQHLFETGSKIVLKLCSQATKLMSYYSNTMGGDATKSVTSLLHEKLTKDPRVAAWKVEDSASIAQRIFSVEIRIYTTATLYLDDNNRVWFMDMKEDFEAVGM
eukprot:scaffold4342_cov166-Ochromonas_danica.AAC.14